MDILLIEKDPLVRDQLKVGLQQFPGIKVTTGVGYRGVNEVRSRSFACVFLTVDPKDPESMGMLAHLRSFDTTTEIVALLPSQEPKALANEKARFDIHSLLRTPLQPKDLFSFLGRFQERHGDRDASRRTASAPRPAARQN
ncbi:MAG: hypothetical protein RLZZ562_1235 [Planctomycetota bacterium]|jgi:hypothetical protein